MIDAAYAPPAPKPRYIPPNARPSLQGYLRYFRIMARNPLEIWTEGHFNQLIHNDRIFGRSYAIVHDPDAIHHYLVTNAAAYGLTPLRRAIFEPVIGNGLLIAEGDLWKRTRKALTPAFTHRHVTGFAPVMKAVAEKHAESLAGKTVSMSREMMTLALNVLMSCLFSDDTDLDTELFSDRIDQILRLAGMPHPLDLMYAPGWMPRVGRGKALKTVADLRAQVAEVLSARRALLSRDGKAPQDFLSLLMLAGADQGEPLSDTEIIDNLITFLSAGHETTARSLTWTFYLLAKTPRVYERVIAEIDEAPLDDLDPAKWSAALPYLTAVLKETMRLYPAASILTRHSLAKDELGGIKIEPETEVVTSPWVLHRHRKLWDRPDIFDPERFLGAKANAIHRYAYLPFGAGPRVCIGASFSMQEMIIVLAAFLQRYSFRHIGGDEPSPVMRITIQPSNGVMMRIGERN